MDKCRICLQFKKTLFSVFEEDNGISYADMLMSIANVKIVEGAYRNSICSQCRRKLRDLYNFKKEIERSDVELNQHFKTFKFNNIDEVKANLMQNIEHNPNNGTGTVADNISILENAYEPIFYRNITITKIDSYKNIMKCNDIPDLKLKIINYESDNDFVNQYNDSDTCDYKSPRRKKVARKQGKKRDTRKRVKHSTLKKVCIKPVILDNIRIIPSRQKSSNNGGITHKKHKHRKRLDMCPHCGIMSSNMKSHIMVHIGEKKYKCSECNRAFSTSNRLNCHKRTHLTVGTFKCDHCVAVFHTKTSLRSHMSIHTNEKNHICPTCNKGFKRKNALRRHTRIHNTSAKSVKCELCNMTFWHKEGLRHHMRVHTGERPFKCEICSQPYSYKHDFNRHCLKKHGVFLKQRSVHIMNEEVLRQEKALMKDLMLRVQGVVKEGEPLNPFQGPSAALAFNAAVKALGSYQIPVDML